MGNDSIPTLYRLADGILYSVLLILWLSLKYYSPHHSIFCILTLKYKMSMFVNPKGYTSSNKETAFAQISIFYWSIKLVAQIFSTSWPSKEQQKKELEQQSFSFRTSWYILQLYPLSPGGGGGGERQLSHSLPLEFFIKSQRKESERKNTWFSQLWKGSSLKFIIN